MPIYYGRGSALDLYRRKRTQSAAQGQRAAAARQALAGQVATTSPYAAAVQSYAEADRFRAPPAAPVSAPGPAAALAPRRPPTTAVAPPTPAPFAEADRYRPRTPPSIPAAAAGPPAPAPTAPRQTTVAQAARTALAPPESRFETGVPISRPPGGSAGAIPRVPTTGIAPPPATDMAEAARAALLAERMAALQPAQTGAPPAPPPQGPPGATATVTAPPGTGAAQLADTSGTQRFSLEAIYNKLNAPVGSPEGYATQEEWNQARDFLRQAAERGNAEARRLLGYTEAAATEEASGETTGAGGAAAGETGGGPGGGAERQRDGTTTLAQISSEVQADLASLGEMGNAQIAEMNSLFADLLSRLEQRRQELISRAEREARELDPATQLALDTLRQDLEEGLRAAKEEANRRGILDSGIAIGMGLKVREGGARAEAMILSDRARRLQQSLEEGLRRIEDQAFGVALERTRAVPEARQRLFETFQRAREAGRARIDTERRFGVETQLEQARMREQQRQANIEAATRLSDLYGTTVFPKMGGEQLFAQVAGRETVAAQQARAALAAATAKEREAIAAEEAERQAASVVSQLHQAKAAGKTRDEIIRLIEQNRPLWAPNTVIQAYQWLQRLWPLETGYESLLPPSQP